jgi:glycosyltransferase involved in cell wall biosynthesis
LELALVLWSGVLGGAERFTAGLAVQLRKLGVSPTIVFLGSSHPLSSYLEQERIRFECMRFTRGSRVLLRPRSFGHAVSACGRNGVIIDSIGYAPVALRSAGYRQRIVSVEHGGVIQRRLSPRRRLVRAMTRAAGAWASDVEVAVSDFVLSELVRHNHAREIVRIHNGVNLDEYRPRIPSHPDEFTIGWAGRMVPGKGVFDLLEATALIVTKTPARLLLAGDGPDRPAIVRRINRLGLDDHVTLSGQVIDMPSFWAKCDIGAVPTNGLTESFGLAAVEAMACGKPVIASRTGGLGEVVHDGTTGLLVDPGDIRGIAAAIGRYARDDTLRHEHGRQARAVCERRFDLEEIARRYLALVEH